MTIKDGQPGFFSSLYYHMTTDQYPDLWIRRKFKRASNYLVAASLLIALLVMVGYNWQIGLLQRPLPRSAPMNPLTALCLLLTCLCFFFLRSSSFVLRMIGRIVAVLVVGLAAGRLAGFYLGFEIDRVLYKSQLKTDVSGLNRMAVIAAVCFILTVTSLAFVRRVRGQMLAQGLAVAVAMAALFSVAGYLYRVSDFYGVLRYLTMALHTAVGFLLLSLGILCARPDDGLMKDFTSGLAGGVHARTLIPIAVVIPLVLGLLRLYGHWAGLFSTEFGVAILVLSIIFVFLCGIRYTTILLNRRDMESGAISKALRASEARYQVLVESIEDYAIFQMDTQGQIQSWNAGAQEIKGYTAVEVMDRPISIFYTEDDVQKGVPGRNLEMARAHGRHSSEGWRIRKDGSRFWADVVITALYNEEGGLTGYAKITRDRTEYKKAQEQIAYLARLIRDTSDAIISVDTGYHIVTWNKAAEQLYGFTEREVYGREFNSIIQSATPESDRIAIRRQLEDKGLWRGELTHYSKAGSPLHFLMSISETRDNEGKVAGFVLVGRDIAERKRQEEELRKFNEDLEEMVRKKTKELLIVFERVSDGFMAFDNHGTITYVNRKAAELNKRDANEMIGKNFWQLFPTAVTNEFGENFHKAYDTQQNAHFQMFSPSLQLWVECFLYPSEDGLSLFYRDISEKRQAEETIHRSREELRQLASHLQDIREEERATISREIHDELGQQLTGIKIDVSWIAKSIGKASGDPLVQKLEGVLGLLDITIKTVRRIATELRPSILDDLGLVAAIEWQSQEFQRRSGILTVFRSSVPDCRFEPSTAIGLFRICQESLTNVARHADASHVWINLDWEGSLLTLRIRDDGRGLSMDATEGKKTLGLLGIRERALMMGGRVELRNGEEGGFILEVTIPMKTMNDA